jgi:hypothetical protein
MMRDDGDASALCPRWSPELALWKSLFDGMVSGFRQYRDATGMAIHSAATNLRNSQVCCMNALGRADSFSPSASTRSSCLSPRHLTGCLPVRRGLARGGFWGGLRG